MQLSAKAIPPVNERMKTSRNFNISAKVMHATNIKR